MCGDNALIPGDVYTLMDSKQHYRLTLFALIVCLVATTITSAQVPPSATDSMSEYASTDTVRLNLRECLDRAMSSNLDVRESELQLALAEVDQFQANMARWLPIFEMRAFTSVVKDAKGEVFPDGRMPIGVETTWREIGPYFQLTGEAVQPITTFGRISSLRTASRYGVRAQTAGIAVQRAKVAGEVYELYYGVLLARELLDILNDVSGKLDGARNRVRSMIEEGSIHVTTLDLARIDIYGYELERMCLEAQKSIRLALGALRRAVAVPYTVPFDIEKGRLRPIPENIPLLDSLQTLALGRRPEIEQVEAGVHARYFQLRAEKARRYPEIFIGMDWNVEFAPGRELRNTNPWFSDGYNTRTARAALGARWQLGLMDRETDIRRARVNYEEMLRKRTWAKQSIALEVQKAYEEAVEAEQKSVLGRRSLRAGRALLLQTVERYDIGVASTRDLIEAYGAYAKSQADYYQTLYDHYLALAELYRTIGRPIWEIGHNGNS